MQSKTKIIKASRSLQMKAGSGIIPAEKVLKAEDAIIKNDEDFFPIAKMLLTKLQDAVHVARTKDAEKKELIEAVIKPVMELKANAQMFKYDLVTTLANIMLNFLESIGTLDKNALAIVEAHHRTLVLIISQKMSGNGGQAGAMLEKELRQACGRYLAKKNS
ncbi:MAG: hypothetical protein DI586_01000 [Micavibrio aeruginosavorus]|uniref:Uncharacterized protein n=1 Tax=Micavibrio aeruginosavorus TaxID=349221 RepID=A0A2W5FTY3_9BACT|nr:MAG: hypothetical protein DI586_01000 [Micavibrio aeruginosavorus]